MKSYEALLSRFVSLIWKYWNDILILTAMDAGNLNDSFVCIVQCELDISAFPGGTQDWWCNNCRHQLNSSLYSPPTWESVQVSMSEVVTWWSLNNQTYPQIFLSVIFTWCRAVVPGDPMLCPVTTVERSVQSGDQSPTEQLLSTQHSLSAGFKHCSITIIR